jgi:hypothetical protein
MVEKLPFRNVNKTNYFLKPERYYIKTRTFSPGNFEI